MGSMKDLYEQIRPDECEWCGVVFEEDDDINELDDCGTPLFLCEACFFHAVQCARCGKYYDESETDDVVNVCEACCEHLDVMEGKKR